MVRYKRWMAPLRNRRPIPDPTSVARVVKISMVDRVASLVKGGVMHKPLWFDAMLAHPPPPPVKPVKPMRLEWEEDRLRRVYLRRNPEANLKPKALFLDPDQPEASYEHEADSFVRQQKAYMRKGASEEEAYRLTLQKVKQLAEESARARKDEVELARKQAAKIGATQSAIHQPANSSGMVQHILRRIAEEAREAGEPYPKHWFADRGKGRWVGIGSQEVIDQMEMVTRKVIRTDEDIGATAAMLGGMDVKNTEDTTEGKDDGSSDPNKPMSS